MKTTRIDIEGRTGKATLFRSGGEIVINLARRTDAGDTTIRRGIGRTDSLLVPASARARELRWQMARQLVAALDGRPGTQGDIDEYFRTIETFAD